MLIDSFMTLLIDSFSFIDSFNIFEPNEHCLQIFGSSSGLQRAKRKFSDNPSHNILELYNILVQIRFTTSKRKLDI